VKFNNVWQLQWRVVLLCLMDLGDGGSLVGSMASECNEGKVMEWTKGISFFKVKCVIFQ